MAPIARLASVRSAVLTLSLVLVTAGVGWGQESYQTVVLDNGLTLLLSPNDAHPVIALSMFVTGVAPRTSTIRVRCITSNI
jgi:hypothetical protein